MHVGQRVSLDGYHGTIKYIGPLQGSPSTWLGIDWDDSSRGKHSGTFKNQQVYVCRPGCGSFLKESRANFDKTQSLPQAIRSKYVEASRGQNEEISRIAGISKPVQSIGFDKIRERFRDVTQVTELFLAKQCIDRLSLDPEQPLSQVSVLDLSWNLIASFEEVVHLCLELSSIKVLKLEGNRFTSTTHNALPDHVSRSIMDLNLNLTLVNWQEVSRIITHYCPAVATLHLALNDLPDPYDSTNIEHITTLNMHGNNITDVHLLLTNFRNVEVLDLSNNKIETILPKEPATSGNSKVKHINLAGNPLNQLQDVANLACCTNLRSLRFTLTFDDKKDELSRLQLIKHLPQLEVVNKTRVTQQERQDAEVLGRPKVTTTQSIANNFVTLKLVSNLGTVEKKVIKTQTVKQLKATFARFAKLKPTQIGTLVFKNDDESVELTDDLAQLSYYAISDGGSIHHVQ